MFGGMPSRDGRRGVARIAALLASAALVMSSCGGGGGDASSAVDGAVEILTAGADAEGGMDALGTFTLRYDRVLNCLYHDEPDNNGEPGTGGRVVIVWPFGYTAVAAEDEVVVLDSTGTSVARAGVAFQMGGGAGPADGGHCDAIGVWVANGPLTGSPSPADDSEPGQDARSGEDVTAASHAPTPPPGEGFVAAVPRLGEGVWLIAEWPEPVRVVRADVASGDVVEELWTQDRSVLAARYQGHSLLCRDLDSDGRLELVDVYFEFEGQLRDTYHETLVVDGATISETTRPVDGTTVPTEINEFCGHVPGPIVRVAVMQLTALLEAAGFSSIGGDHAIDPVWEAVGTWDGVEYWPLSLYQGDFRPAVDGSTELFECEIGGLQITRELPNEALVRIVELAGCDA